MCASKVRRLGFFLSVSVLLAGGAAGFWSDSPRPRAEGVEESKLKALLKERLAALQEAAARTTEEYKTGTASVAEVMAARRGVRDAELELCDTDKERLAVLEKMLEEARGFEKDAAKLVDVGKAPANSVFKAKADRLQIEIALERLKGKAAPGQERARDRLAPPARVEPPVELQELAALAERQVATKRAAVKVADAQKGIAEAKLKVLKTKVDTAKAAETQEKAKLQRTKNLVDKAMAPGESLLEAEASYQAAALRRQEAEDRIGVGEADVALEAARREVAVAELGEAELRLKQLQERLKSKER
jgi:hypothetical protein